MSDPGSGLYSVRSPQYGILYMILMSGCVISMDASAKLLTSEMPLMMIVWGRFFFNFIFVALFFFRSDPRDFLRTQRLFLQILRSLLGLGASFAFWWALAFLSLPDCVAIAFISPLLVTALSAPLLGEQIGIHRWGAVLIGFAGVVIIIRPGLGVGHWAVILPLIAALFWASYQITTRLLSRTDRVLTTLFYTAAGALFFTTLAVWSVWVTPTIKQWFILACAGFLGTLGHYFLIRAFELAPASMLAPFNYTSILWSILLGYVLFGDFPDGWSIAGVVVVISSGLYIMHRERRLAERKNCKGESAPEGPGVVALRRGVR
jgi:drug/metabolite transporter (DMT)-like permease